MKQRLLLAFAMLMSFCSFSWADEELSLITEVDWTEQTEYYGDDIWYSQEAASLAFNNGLEITSETPEGVNHWDVQVPIIAHIPFLKGGGNYQVKLCLDASVTGTVRLDLCSWDGSGATMAYVLNVTEGLHEYTIDFSDYNSNCTNAMLFFQFGKLPGKYLIKTVQLWGELEEYAVLSRDGKTLTFYNDAFKGSRDGVVCEINNATGLPGWYRDFDWDENNPNDKIETMVFDKSFSTARPTTLDYWFRNQKSLSKIEGISNLNTSKVNNMNLLFSGCESLKTLDLSHFNTSQVTNMDAMFEKCSSLTSIDLSNFDTSRVQQMYSMFYYCNNLKSLDLTSFNTGMLKAMGFMFYCCGKLETIYVSDAWDLTNVEEENSTYMFDNCPLLKGEKGTTYNREHLDKTYACIDGGSDNPGYLSSVSALYNLTVADTEVSKTNCNDILGDGCFEYSPVSKTLYLKGSCTLTDSEYFNIIRSTVEGLTIDVTKDVVLDHRGAYCPIWLDRSTTIKGVGKLTLKAKATANAGLYLYDGASVVIDHMNMDVSGNWGIAGPNISAYNGEKVTIISSNITISATEAAICDLPGGIDLQGCSFTFPEGAYIEGYGVKGPAGVFARDVTIVADNGITTGGVERLNDNGEMINDKARDAWYTIDGRKLSGKPKKKGIYIHNGHKRVVK